VSIVWRSYELAVLIVIVIFGVIALWNIIRNSKIHELNLNIDSDLLLSPECGIDSSALYFSGLKLVWRGTQEIPVDWDVKLKNFIYRGEQRAFTLKLLGRELTFVVDGRNQVIERGVCGRILLTLIDLKDDTDLRGSHAHIKGELLIGGIQLPASHKEQEPSRDSADASYK
jgi:hypothetical protein